MKAFQYATSHGQRLSDIFKEYGFLSSFAVAWVKKGDQPDFVQEQLRDLDAWERGRRIARQVTRESGSGSGAAKEIEGGTAKQKLEVAKKVRHVC
jgi:hypothetical protein